MAATSVKKQSATAGSTDAAPSLLRFETFPSVVLGQQQGVDIAVGTKIWVANGCKPSESSSREDEAAAAAMDEKEEIEGHQFGSRSWSNCSGVEAIFDSSRQWLRACDYLPLTWSVAGYHGIKPDRASEGL